MPGQFLLRQSKARLGGPTVLDLLRQTFAVGIGDGQRGAQLCRPEHRGQDRQRQQPRRDQRHEQQRPRSDAPKVRQQVDGPVFTGHLRRGPKVAGAV